MFCSVEDVARHFYRKGDPTAFSPKQRGQEVVEKILADLAKSLRQ
jgi:hypothetical protein